MSDRDELAELFDEIALIVRKADRTERLLWDDAVRAASAVRAAGYRKQHTSATTEESEALRVAREQAWDEGADAVTYDPESRDFLTQPENPYRS